MGARLNDSITGLGIRLKIVFLRANIVICQGQGIGKILSCFEDEITKKHNDRYFQRFYVSNE